MLSETTSQEHSQEHIERGDSKRKDKIRIGDCDINPGSLKKPRLYRQLCLGNQNGLVKVCDQKDSLQTHERPTIFNWGNLSPKWNIDSLDWDYIFPTEIRNLIDEMCYERSCELPEVVAFDSLYKRPFELHVTSKWIYDKLDFILDVIFVDIRLEFYRSKYKHSKSCALIWRQGTKFHRKNGLPAIILHNETKLYLENGLLHRISGPAIDGPGFKLWFVNGIWHNFEGPAFMEFSLTGSQQETSKPFRTAWLINGQLNRGDDKPAYDTFDRLGWYIDGKASREHDKPADIILSLALYRSTISLKWYTNGVLDRKGDNPALISEDGSSLIWSIDGIKARKNEGPHQVRRMKELMCYAPHSLHNRNVSIVLFRWYSENSEILRDNHLKRSSEGQFKYLGEHLGALYCELNESSESSESNDPDKLAGISTPTSVSISTALVCGSDRNKNGKYKDDDEYENEEEDKRIQSSEILVFGCNYGCVEKTVETYWHKNKKLWVPKEWLKNLRGSIYSKYYKPFN